MISRALVCPAFHFQGIGYGDCFQVASPRCLHAWPGQGLGSGWAAGEKADKLTPPEFGVVCFFLQLQV